MRSGIFILLAGCLLFYNQRTYAQYAPVAVSGFTQDVVAEGGPSSLATTTAALDAPGSNKIMYTTAFASFASITNGLPNNGTLVNGADTYQLGSFTGNNALYVMSAQTMDLTLNTPASFAKVRLVCFSTEGPSTVNISLSFTDGTTTNYISNYNLPDWFFGTTNIITQGFGRCSRLAAGPYTPDGLPSNPRIYYIEITLNCTDIPKLLQKATISNVSASGNAPFPNAVFLGMSGLAFSETITPVITPSDCSGPNGSIALTVAGSSGPYTYSWNTTPVQTGATATGLAPGTYTCVVTDAAGCIRNYTGTVPLNNNAAITVSANPVSVCPGGSATLTATATTGNLNTYSWSPGSVTGNPITVNPASTTTYTVTGTNALGCTANAQVTVTVNPVPAIPVINPQTICSGNTALLQIQSPQPGYIYHWYDASSAGNLLATGTAFTTPPLTSSTTYYVDAVNGSGCNSNGRASVTVTVTPLPPAPTVTNLSVCSGSNATLQVNNPQPGITYTWFTAAAGGTTLSSGPSYTLSNVTNPFTVYVEAATSGGCTSNTRGQGVVSILQPVPAPVVTLTNAGFNSLTFSWNSVSGATGYEVSINGGASFQPPSSGPTGTTHTVSGLAGNITITIIVRALGPQSCQNSTLSAPVSGTTLSSKEIFVPNVFTPNNDGRNDVLKVYGNYISTIEFRIFNQWGEMIFYTTTPGQGWDGMAKGKPQPVGVYAYTLKVTRQDGSIVTKKGAINLIR